jgi:phenylalanyl-tRNA synthetase alpha chain
MNDTTQQGLLHPLSLTAQEIAKIMTELGFEAAEGPEIVSEWDNFDSVNVPKDHPARDMQDTFFIKGHPGHVLRTHTSAHQVAYLKKHKDRLHNGPLKMFSIGKVFRQEATDATHEVAFYQCEGFMVGKGIHMGHLRGALGHFIQKFLRTDNAEMRFRPGYFPFVEPGAEVDLKFKGKWQEVLGAGMIHPQVLRNADIDPTIYTGFAWGAGLDRLAMVRHNIDDVRLFYQGDLRLHHNLK